jgi:hypothetical protein
MVSCAHGGGECEHPRARCFEYSNHQHVRTTPHRTAPHGTALHRTAPHRTAPHRTAPHRTAPRRAAPRSGLHEPGARQGGAAQPSPSPSSPPSPSHPLPGPETAVSGRCAPCAPVQNAIERRFTVEIFKTLRVGTAVGLNFGH